MATHPVYNVGVTAAMDIKQYFHSAPVPLVPQSWLYHNFISPDLLTMLSKLSLLNGCVKTIYLVMELMRYKIHFRKHFNCVVRYLKHARIKYYHFVTYHVRMWPFSWTSYFISQPMTCHLSPVLPLDDVKVGPPTGRPSRWLGTHLTLSASQPPRHTDQL